MCLHLAILSSHLTILKRKSELWDVNLKLHEKRLHILWGCEATSAMTFQTLYFSDINHVQQYSPLNFTSPAKVLQILCGYLISCTDLFQTCIDNSILRLNALAYTKWSTSAERKTKISRRFLVFAHKRWTQKLGKDSIKHHIHWPHCHGYQTEENINQVCTWEKEEKRWR